MAQKLLNSDLAELIAKMKLAQQYVMTRYVKRCWRKSGSTFDKINLIYSYLITVSCHSKALFF